MFTGIIQAIGEVAALESRGGDLRLRIRTGRLDLGDVVLGDSIAVNGVCLTAVDLPGDGFWADVSSETLSRTLLRHLNRGSRVNLEKALTPTTRLGGHLVSGHVDGVGTIVSRRAEARSIRFVIAAPAAIARYIAEKGSICVDGVSLTVNGVDGAMFDLNIVPHTLVETIIGEYVPGRAVNLEVDVIARYLERLLLGERAAQPQGGITREMLAEAGFIDAR
ncbi:Riboflavin synthase [Gammaproteobacteria bacterium]